MAGRLVGRTKVPEIRRGDTVLILTGKDAGKRGTVERVVRDSPTYAKLAPSAGGKGRARRTGSWRRVSARPNSVVVAGLNVAKRHTKARPRLNQSDRTPKIQQGGIIDLALPIAMSNVMIICPRCDRPTRIHHRALDDGSWVRICAQCGEQMEASA